MTVEELVDRLYEMPQYATVMIDTGSAQWPVSSLVDGGDKRVWDNDTKEYSKEQVVYIE